MSGKLAEKDRARLVMHGIGTDEAERQLQMLREPSHFTRLERPCTVGDGIQRITPDRFESLIASHEQAARLGRWTEFVPASGAASRMFALSGEQDFDRLVGSLPHFAFYRDLERVARQSGQSIEHLSARRDITGVLSLLRSGSGLGYEDLPKGLLKFHRYGETSRTPFEEHLREAAHCLSDADRRCRAHFTVSPSHKPLFEDLLAELIPILLSESGATLEVTFSLQKPSTDTLAIDEEGEPLRTDDGSLVLRPGGHGALLENLNDLQADLVFVKNIDNVCHARLRDATELWIRLLGGYLVQLQDEIRVCQSRFEQESIETACRRTEQFLRIAFPGSSDALAGDADSSERRRRIERALHRPLRVCGVVRNAGETGGGPFWVCEADRQHSLQIVERAEVNPDDASQLQMFASASHFNPV
ncbi:MAG: DUF4301 family protein, partial [Planctomycetes bacterium]|nr:DUF4301 family protein [Planctomycetota bacterium]